MKKGIRRGYRADMSQVFEVLKFSRKSFQVGRIPVQRNFVKNFETRNFWCAPWPHLLFLEPFRPLSDICIWIFIYSLYCVRTSIEINSLVKVDRSPLFSVCLFSEAKAKFSHKNDFRSHCGVSIFVQNIVSTWFPNILIHWDLQPESLCIHWPRLDKVFWKKNKKQTHHMIVRWKQELETTGTEQIRTMKN